MILSRTNTKTNGRTNLSIEPLTNSRLELKRLDSLIHSNFSHNSRLYRMNLSGLNSRKDHLHVFVLAGGVHYLEPMLMLNMYYQSVNIFQVLNSIIHTGLSF